MAAFPGRNAMDVSSSATAVVIRSVAYDGQPSTSDAVATAAFSVPVMSADRGGQDVKGTTPDVSHTYAIGPFAPPTDDDYDGPTLGPVDIYLIQRMVAARKTTAR
jgi:hypothetical protein